MTHAQIGGQHGKAQIARFLTDTASEMKLALIATSGTGNYSLCNIHTSAQVFVGSAEDALAFLEELE
ncbi:MAG: hypothetical protein EHM48_00120 [Planctomycetaceae bacterium]|nr:MAG: hypothetical protein EHM48_00120 [Planctomycetaceae bacterium]